MYLLIVVITREIVGDPRGHRRDSCKAIAAIEKLFYVASISARFCMRILAIVHCALCIVHCALCIVHCALCIVHCALCIVHCALCIVYFAFDFEFEHR